MTTDAIFPRCERCGTQHAKAGPSGRFLATCKAHRAGKRPYEPCMRWPITGGDVCARHGGQWKHVKEKADERVIMAGIQRAMVADLANTRTDPSQTNPLQGLVWEVAMSAQAVEWLAANMARLEVPDLEGGPMANIVGVDDDGNEIEAVPGNRLWGADHNGDAAPHILWAMWNQERERHAKMCKLAIEAGVSERMVALAENQARTLAAVITRVLDDLELSPVMRRVATASIARELRSIGTGEGMSSAAG